MSHKPSYGNATIVVIVGMAIATALFLVVPLGGKLGDLREAAISFIFKKPPRFVSLEADVEGVPNVVKAGQSLRIKGGETLIIRKITANTFFESYLTADVEGFGRPNDVNEPIDTAEIRDRLMGTGVHSVPITVSYLDRVIAKVPLEISLTTQDFEDRLAAAKTDKEKIAVLRSAHEAFPREETFLKRLTDLLSAQGDYASLIDIYKADSARDPQNTTLLASLSLFYLKAGRLDEALDACKRIVDAGAADVEIYRRMAYIAGMKGDFDGRVSYLKKAMELDPNNQDVVVDLAKTYEQAGFEGKAMEVYRGAGASARDREILVPLVRDALSRKDYREAKTLLERYVKQYPDDANALAQLAMVNGRLGETKSQIENYERAARISPDKAVLWYNLGVSREKAGDHQGALEAYERVLGLAGGDTDALSGAARTALKLARYQQAKRYYEDLAKRQATRENLRGLVAASLGAKDEEAVIRACKAFLERYRDHDVAVILAGAYESRAASKQGRARLDDLAKALDAYKTARAIDPSSKIASEKIPELSIAVIKLKKSASP
ncbi:MAG TPA: tetratricopeptide repeat protein [Deltaproteobacteria bacterium]|nr:tetratricopeptide repeat protein [Deltaproteobacteria bacterium]HOM27976.1 tetratricopeptide repeat protein [Deltaproteobacteria bacterium]HPP79931.1 tetratricopeptide repeat protein [Deltaproteobacteria bacterium]